jgi:hypothetical protein
MARQISPPGYDGGILILRIDQSLLCDASSIDDVAVGKDPNTSPLFEVLEGKLEHMGRYGPTRWLLDVCHNIFDPLLRRGSQACHLTRPTLCYHWR